MAAGGDHTRELEDHLALERRLERALAREPNNKQHSRASPRGDTL